MRNKINISTKKTILFILWICLIKPLCSQVNYEQKALDYLVSKKDMFFQREGKVLICDSISNDETVLSYFPFLNFDESRTKKLPIHNTKLNVPKKYRVNKRNKYKNIVWIIDRAIEYENDVYVLARNEKLKNPIGGKLILFKLSVTGEVLSHYESNWIK